ncbi:hypothetical protein KIN20_036428 [Parelaphostrongylus tenuis]|uniref:Uncharacterized protein n=1 Tax=Parelaphostrongylus tenuis TaxID=148309 RepID=A0AAD5WLA5_PARTN|nr:hypothetical protein KIN20_036428 [Parelaphostrongylus tenuis]
MWNKEDSYTVFPLSASSNDGIGKKSTTSCARNYYWSLDKKAKNVYLVMMQKADTTSEENQHLLVDNVNEQRALCSVSESNGTVQARYSSAAPFPLQRGASASEAHWQACKAYGDEICYVRISER